MPMYPFESADGGLIERFFHMAEAPPIGHRIVVDGVEYVRRIARQHASVEPETRVANWTLSPSDARKLGHREFNEDGQPVFCSKRSIDELVSRSQDTTTPIANVR